jgi:hypothetical protein
VSVFRLAEVQSSGVNDELLDFGKPGQTPIFSPSEILRKRTKTNGGAMKTLKQFFILNGLLVLLAACSDKQFSSVEATEDVEMPDQGPAIMVVQAPKGDLSVFDQLAVEYRVIPGSSPVTDVSCAWNGISIPCKSDKDRVVLPGGKIGGHKFEIVATDENGLQDRKNLPWKLFERFKKEQTRFSVTKSDRQLDVLFVVDNSLSMQDEQKSMAAKINSFMDRIKDFDWQIGIVTTDPGQKDYGDGRLLAYDDGSFILNSKLDLTKARQLFAKTIQRTETGSPNEQGIRATARAIQRSTGSSAEVSHRQFFREHSALAAVVLSDENESGEQNINKGTALLRLISNTWGEHKIFQFHSIIVRPDDTVCKAAATVGAHYYGTAYADLTKLTGGVLGSICEEDYGNQLSLIGQSVANSKTTYDLECTPKDIDGDGVSDVTVKATGGAVVPNFTVNGNQITFSKPPQEGQYDIDYFCPQK